MLELMIAGAITASAAVIAHKIYKWAKNAIKTFLKQNGLKKNNVRQAFIVFSVYAGSVIASVIANIYNDPSLLKRLFGAKKIENDLVLADQAQRKFKELPEEVKMAYNKVNKKNFFGQTKHTQDFHYATYLQY